MMATLFKSPCFYGCGFLIFCIRFGLLGNFATSKRRVLELWNLSLRLVVSFLVKLKSSAESVPKSALVEDSHVDALRCHRWSPD